MDWLDTPDPVSSENAGDQSLCDHQRRPDGHQRQQHRHRAAVHEQQYGEHQHGDRDLDRQPIVLARDREVGDGRRRTGDVHL